MDTKKLFAATSVAALLAGGSAQALDLVGAKVTLADEMDFTAPQGGVLALEVKTNDDLPLANGYKLTVNLTGDLQFKSLTGGAVFGTGIGGAVISSGGADGSQSAVLIFNTSTATAGKTNAIQLDPQIQVAGKAGGTVSIVLTDPNGSTIEGGSASLENSSGTSIQAIDFANAFSLSIAADQGNSFLDFGTTPAYAGFDTSITGDTATAAPIGTVTLALASGVSRSTGTAFTPVVPADAASYKVTINMPDTTGINAVKQGPAAVNGFGTASASKSGNAYTMTVTGPATAAATSGTASGQIEVTTTSTGTKTQSPSATLLELNFASGTGLVAKENGTIAALDVIDLEGVTTPTFKWVGDASAPTGQVFRITGIKTSIPVIYVTLTNSTNNLDGVYVVPTTGKTLSGNTKTGKTELVLNNIDIQNAVGAAYGRADVKFTITGLANNDTTTDTDRLLSAGGTVSAYGDTNNQ